MKRATSLAIAVAIALGTQQALALGLGQIQVKSALGQPLLAEIPVRFDSAAEAKSLHLAIASPAAYQRAGISTNQMGIPLQFALVKTRDGGHAIRVTTADPVRDPYVDFLLDAGWSSGSLIREYTILLDPPGYSSASSGSVPAHAPAAAPAAVAPAPTAAPATPVAVPGSATVGGNAATYTVKGGDTAYAIATRNLPSGVSVDQMLRALQQENPQAFIHGNINELRSGAILRIPTAITASAIPPAAARAAVRQQTEAWQARAPQPLLNASSVASTAAPTAAVAAAPAGGHLELVPPARGGGGAPRAGVKGGTGNAAVAGLKQQLARAQETVASEQLHSADLKARIAQLQKINTDNAKLLALRNNEVAQLQAKLAQVEAAAAKPAPAQSAPPGASAPSVAASAPATVAAAAAALPVRAASVSAPAPAVSAAAKPTAPAPARKPPQPVAPAPQPESSAPIYQQPLVLGGAALLVVLGLLGLVFARRKRSPAAPARASLADQFAAAVPVAATDASEQGSEDEAQLRAELNDHPDDLGLYLELASLQYGHMDSTGFTATAEAMHAHVSHEDAAEWQAVRAMGAEIAPQHPLFAGSAAAVHGDELDAEPDLAQAAPEYAEPAMEPVAPEVHELDAALGQAYEDPYAPMTGGGAEIGGDPIDTKLDLARAYLDMGDYEGARAMLEEVLTEGSQTQKDEAQRLLDSAH